MLERFDYSVTLPYERRRDKDFDGSTMIVSTKPFGEGKTEQYLYLYPKGRVRERTVLFSYPNTFERQYIFHRGNLTITARNEMTNFGVINYDKTGAPFHIQSAPFYITEYVFRRDTLVEGDSEIMNRELEKYDEELAVLGERYGGLDNVPAEAFPSYAELCPKHSEYGERLRRLSSPADFYGLDIFGLEFKQGKWVVVEQVESSINLQEFLAEMKRVQEGEVQLEDSWVSEKVKTRDVLAVNWEEQFLYDEKLFAISKAGNQLVFRQESIGSVKKKIIQAPLHINYRNLRRVMSDPTDWERIANEYPTNFFAEL